jgi:DNA modification methylase
LNKLDAREGQDEKHLCPLQLDVIERAVALWSNPGDLVYSPFTGIGSEGYQALKMNRRFVGSELKESYFRQACGNLENANAQTEFALV